MAIYEVNVSASPNSASQETFETLLAKFEVIEDPRPKPLR